MRERGSGRGVGTMRGGSQHSERGVLEVEGKSQWVVLNVAHHEKFKVEIRQDLKEKSESAYHPKSAPRK